VNINQGIARNEIVLFLDNCSAHTSNYSMTNLYNLDIKIIFNSPCTPDFNIIETVFGDMKRSIRNHNYS